MMVPALAEQLTAATDAELDALWRRSVEVAEARYMKDGRYPGPQMFALRMACGSRDFAGLSEQDDAFQTAIAKLLQRVRGGSAASVQPANESKPGRQ